MLDLLPEVIRERYLCSQEILMNEEEAPVTRKPFKAQPTLMQRPISISIRISSFHSRS